jgi:hypothetical protein
VKVNAYKWNGIFCFFWLDGFWILLFGHVIPWFLLLMIALAVASVDVQVVHALPHWSASPNEAESGRPDVVWPAISKVHWEHRFELFVDQQGLWWLFEYVWACGVMAELDKGLDSWCAYLASWRDGWWCDSYPQMSLFVRWNNNLKNTHFSITW